MLLHLMLFLATVVTTLGAGAFLEGNNPLKDFSSLRTGIPFSFTLMSILLVHELAHYFTSRRHGLKTSLPYFIPAPTVLGTFGAVIKMKSVMPNRKAILDIGVAGPLAGFILSIIAVTIGFHLSPVVGNISRKGALGSSIILHWIFNLVKGPLPAGHGINLHPMAFAGWIGLLITAINLLPAGQLDGGHIAYSLLGRKKHLFLARFTLYTMLAMGLLWPGWFIWAMLILFIGEKHPPPLNDITPLDGKRKVLALLTFIIFVLTFMPIPFSYR